MERSGHPAEQEGGEENRGDEAGAQKGGAAGRGEPLSGVGDEPARQGLVKRAHGAIIAEEGKWGQLR